MSDVDSRKIVALLKQAIDYLAADVEVIKMSCINEGENTCIGITGGEFDCMRILCEVIKSEVSELQPEKGSYKHSYLIHFQKVLDALLKYSKEERRLGVVIYWPNLPWKEPDN
jgi:hypothetical protein